jgi:imidazolonepropionase
MKATLLIQNIKTIYTPVVTPPVHGIHMNKIKEIHQGFIAVKDATILDFGVGDGGKYIDNHTIIHNANQAIVVPGFIDSHSHLVHAGSREDEYEKLNDGVPYLDILRDGGGILGTVEKTRKASFEALYRQAMKSLDHMLSYGVTVLEAKSGYGLNFENEVKQLEVAKQLELAHPISIQHTYMGAHAIPKEYAEDREGYISSILEDMKKIKEFRLAGAVDVFCETGVFSLMETKRILSKAKDLGFIIKMHADEIHPLGGAGLGVDLHCSSVDHLMAIRDEDIEKLAYSNTIANLLPGTSFYLKKGYANARKMIDEGVAVSISGDYNPGSCPTENFQFIMQLASRELKMTPYEILNAVTINPAYHLGLSATHGSIEIGKYANLVCLDAPNLPYIFYHYGINHTKDVYIEGKRVVYQKQIVRS